MVRRIFISLLVIAMAIAAMTGATLAWFTAEVELQDNVFTAGTVTLDAEDSWEGNAGMVVDNWNPGDCSPKYIGVQYTGSKRAFMRMQISGEWEVNDPILSNANVTWKVYKGTDIYANLYNAADGTWNLPAPYTDLRAWFNDINEWADYDLDADPNWTLADDGWYYFAGGTDTTTTVDIIVGGATVSINAIDPDPAANDPGMNVQIMLHAVCLDGLLTNNDYQGKSYTISAKFQAIQASHEGEWTWGDFDTYNPVTP